MLHIEGQKILTVKAYCKMTGSMSIACRLVITGRARAETPMMLVKAREVTVEKRMVSEIG
jgi:hypothetical protein